MKERLLALTGFDKSQHNIRTELLGGLTTFVTMCYVLVVNPTILSGCGMDKESVFFATAITAALATLIMAFWGKKPFAYAPDIAVIALFAFTIVSQMGHSWQTALAVMLVVGVAYTLIVLLNIQKYILKAVPENFKHAIPVGVGIFIAFIGLENSGLIVGNKDTLVTLSPFNNKNIIAYIGIILSALLLYKKVRGGLFISIIVCTLIGIPMGVTTIPDNFTLVSLPSHVEPTAKFLDFSHLLDTDLIILMFTLLLICIFDTMGTLLGLAEKTGIKDITKDTKTVKVGFLSASIATAVGSLLGTGALCAFSESASGIAEGGRTGLTAVTTAVLFLLALFLAPLFLIIPMTATTGALVMVGVMMMGQAKKIDFSDYTEALPAFITVIMIPLAYSIGEGLMIGLLTYVVIKLISGKFKDLNIAICILAALIAAKYIIDFTGILD